LPEARMTSGASATNSAVYLRKSLSIAGASPAIVDPYVAADLQPASQERRETRLSFRIVCGKVHEHADPPHPLALLRPRRERPCGPAPPSSVMKSRRL